MSDKIWEEVKANSEKLKYCEHHLFDIDMDPAKTIGKKWKCSYCGGVVDSIKKSWFDTGFRQAMKALLGRDEKH